MAILIRSLDIWHEVPLIAQVTGMNCWAAAAAMLVGWRDQLNFETEDIAHRSAPAEASEDGLRPSDVEALAEVWGLVVEPPRLYNVDALATLLSHYGPLWVGQADPDLHVIVIAGMHGNSNPGATWVRINDPWPIGRGERYSITVQVLEERFRVASRITGVHAQVLHTGGRGRS